MVTLEIEPLNGLVDHPGIFLQYTYESASIIEQVNSPNIELVFDDYHQKITEGNVIRSATKYLDYINHYHIADNSGRQQPRTGKLNYINILKVLKQTGVDGFIGLEFAYTLDTDLALEAFKQSILAKV